MRKIYLLLFTMLVSLGLSATEVTATWSFRNPIPSALASLNMQGSSTGTGDLTSDVEGITCHVDATSGKLYTSGRSDWAQFNSGTIIQVPVQSTEDVVQVQTYSAAVASIGGVAMTETIGSHTASSAEVTAGYVVVEATANDYLGYIKVTQHDPVAKVIVGISRYWGDGEDQKAGYEYFAMETSTRYVIENYSLPDTDNQFWVGGDDVWDNTFSATAYFSSTFTETATGWYLGAGTPVTLVVDPTQSSVSGSNLNIKAEYNYVVAWNADGSNWEYAPFEWVEGNKFETTEVTLNGGYYAGGWQGYVGIEKADGWPNFWPNKSENTNLKDMTGLAYETGDLTGKFRIYNNSDNANWYCRFISKLSYQLLNDDESAFYPEQSIWSDATSYATTIPLAVPTKSGYTCIGWSRTKNATTADMNAGAAYNFWKTADTFYPVWEEVTAEPTEVDFTIDFRTNPYTNTGTHMSATTVTAGSFNDASHGYTNAVASIPVPGNVRLTIGTCQYGSEKTITVKDANGNTVGTAAGKTASCSEAVIDYMGDATTLTVTCGNYCPYIKVATFNTEDTASKNAAGTQYEVIANSARNLKACLAAAASDASCKTVYVPNGTYDFGTEMNIAVSGSNLHIIGESMDDVIIKNAPTTEALKNGLIHNTGDHNTFENLTLWCQSTWGGSAERGPALFDEGNYTICKDVYLKGTQDTYFSNSTGMKYFLRGKIEGTVDFICGMGKIFFESVELICTQSTNHTTYDIIIAPDAETGKGSNDTNGTKFVFKDATYSGDAPTYYLGRSWKGTNTAYFGGTMFDDEFAPVGYDSESYFTQEGQTLTDQIGAAAGGTITITAGLNVMRDYELFGEEWHPVAGLFEPHVRTMTVGNYGTVCLPFGYTVSGADIYSIEGKMVDGSDNPTAIVLRQVESAMYPAGDPYIFQATASTVTFTPKADYSTYEMPLNELQGTFTDIDFYYNADENAWEDADDCYKHIYVLNNNTFKLSKWTAEGQSGVRAYRAYIENMDGVSVYDPEQYGEAKVQVLGIEDETGIDGIECATIINDTDVTSKTIKDGKIVIIRSGKMYDVLGRSVK